MACSEAEDAGGLAPAKVDNEAARFFIRRTLPILDCVDYKIPALLLAHILRHACITRRIAVGSEEIPIIAQFSAKPETER